MYFVSTPPEFAALLNLSKKAMKPVSSLSFMELKNVSDPFAIFKEWIQEAKEAGAVTTLMNLATASKEGKVKNRTVVIREIMPDGALAFMALEDSAKIKDIKENPQVAATVLLMYFRDNTNITKQVRFTGMAEKLPQDRCRKYFDQDNLPGKIRALIVEDAGPNEWFKLKEKHDALLKDIVENKKEFQMPNTQVAYKIVADEVDFYFSAGDSIADRVLFKLVDNTWSHERMKP